MDDSADPRSAARAAATPSNRVPTVDGTRLEISDLNIGAGPTPATENSNIDRAGVIRRVARAVSLFLAGMYTGVKCGGVPHSHHTYDRERDNRPL